MARQISKDKKQISVVLTIEQIKRLDGRAAELGTNRTALISEAVDALLDGAKGKSGTGLAVSAQLEAIAAKLDGLASGQGELKAQQLAQATVIVDAVKNQPIAVQQLPAAEPEAHGPTPAEVRAYLEDRYPGRFEFNMFDEPVPARRGLAARIFGRK